MLYLIHNYLIREQYNWHNWELNLQSFCTRSFLSNCWAAGFDLHSLDLSRPCQCNVDGQLGYFFFQLKCPLRLQILRVKQPATTICSFDTELNWNVEHFVRHAELIRGWRSDTTSLESARVLFIQRTKLRSMKKVMEKNAISSHLFDLIYVPRMVCPLGLACKI